MCLKEAFCPQSRHGLHSARRTSPSRPTSRADHRLGALLRHRQAIRLANAPHPQGLHELALLKFRMFKLDLDKTWVICVFSGAFALLVLYALWPYIAAAIVVYAIAQELSAPRHLGNRRSCRRWIGRLNCR